MAPVVVWESALLVACIRQGQQHLNNSIPSVKKKIMVGMSLLTALDKVSMVDIFYSGHGGHVSWWACFMVGMFHGGHVSCTKFNSTVSIKQ